MLFRIIILGAVIAFAVMLYRKWQSGEQVSTRTGKDSPVMRKCAHCGVHLPDADAIRVEERFFCSESHRLAYDKEHRGHE